MHVDSWLQVCEEFAGHTDRESWSAQASSTVSTIGHGLRQALIVHLDMIKSRQGVSLYSLINEAKTQGFIEGAVCTNLRQEIDQHSRILNNISRQRNNLVAHRSPSHTFKEISDTYPVTNADVAVISRMYYAVALELHRRVPFQNPWALVDQRSGARAILRGLANTRNDNL